VKAAQARPSFSSNLNFMCMPSGLVGPAGKAVILGDADVFRVVPGALGLVMDVRYCLRFYVAGGVWNEFFANKLKNWL